LDLRTREGGLLQTRGRATGRRSGRRLIFRYQNDGKSHGFNRSIQHTSTISHHFRTIMLLTIILQPVPMAI
jgi:hypothetical protein